jgi:hypothetical protein
MASLGTSFSLSSVKSVVMSKPKVLLVLAVAFVASTISMVINAYCAAEIEKSTCKSTDEHAKMAYKGNWVASVLSALVMLGSLGAVAFVIMSHK